MQDLRVTLVQRELQWEEPADNRSGIEASLSAIEGGTDMVVLPEMFTTGFTMDAAPQAQPMDGSSVNWLRDAAARLSAWVCGSVIIEENQQFYNRFLAASPDGELVQYDKRHLFRLADE